MDPYDMSEHERFMKEFIAIYKDNPVLWDQTHPNYRTRSERSEAYAILLEKCNEYYKSADEDFVRMKIDSMRSTFRREYRKVKMSREETPKDVYKPSLWYYDLLLFTCGEDIDGKDDKKDVSQDIEDQETTGTTNETNYVRIPFWSREYSAILIDLYRRHPCLYSVSDSHYKNMRRRKEALKKIGQDLMTATGKYFQVDDVRRKIGLIRGQFLYEYKKVMRSKASSTSGGSVYKPTLWCFKLLEFLTDQYTKLEDEQSSLSKMNLRQNREPSKRHRDSTEESGDEDSWEFTKKGSDSSVTSETYQIDARAYKQETPKHMDPLDIEKDDDIFDAIAKNTAHKLREMTNDQRKIAQKILNDLMYHGQMENLTNSSRLILE